MNMQFVWWLTGVLLTIAGCKFVIAVFKRIANKDTFDTILDNATNGINHTADKVGKYIKQKKKEKNDNRPMVTIH